MSDRTTWGNLGKAPSRTRATNGGEVGCARNTYRKPPNKGYEAAEMVEGSLGRRRAGLIVWLSGIGQMPRPLQRRRQDSARRVLKTTSVS